MNKNAIKKYAIWARNELIDRVSHRAAVYGITDEDHGDMNADSVNGSILTVTEKRQRQALIRKVNAQGFQQVMEEVAFTWFNRFAALRFMEVNGYLPSHVRVFTNDEGEFKPQMLTEAIHLELDGLDKGKVFALEKANLREELFKYLLITQCNALSAILPGLFQKIDDYTELLLPDFLLREGSVIQQMVEMIPEEDWTDQVQIIGWLYQYYNTEPKDKVFGRKSGEKIKKEEIPAATQLFTPDWIVRYMVENSLGRLWLEGHPNDELKSGWKYYLDEAQQEPEVAAQLAEIRKEYAALKPEDIRVIDPCMGSGHILCYLFDVLVQIYEAYGYSVREAVRLIVEKNLYGLDLDERAGQLAYFAVMMKARQYDRRFFSRNKDENGDPIVPQPHLGHFQDLSLKPEDFSDPALQSLVKAFEHADEYGSLLEISEKNIDIEAAANAVDAYTDDFLVGLDAREKLLRMVQLVRMLSQKYDVVVTNPPYMGSSNMYDGLNKFIKERYADYKSDFFSAFIVRVSKMTKSAGYCGFFTPYVWMFIQSYENLRQYLYNSCTIETLIQFEYSAFEEATVPVCTLAFKNSQVKRKKGAYLRLTDFRGGMEVQRQKTLEAICNHQCGFYYEQTTDNFSKIPGAPVAYWVSDKFIEAYIRGKRIDEIAVAKQGSTLGDNARFVRFWFEIINNPNKWFKCMKGGEYRRWYGNQLYLLDWENNGERVKSTGRATIRSESLLFKEGITWSNITSGKNSFRYMPEGFFFESTGTVCFTEKERLWYLLAFCNTPIAEYINKVINPTLHLQSGDVARLPVILPTSHSSLPTINTLVEQNISLSRADWDSFETSWDFKKHPLIPKRNTSPQNSPLTTDHSPLKIEFALFCVDSLAEDLGRDPTEVYDLLTKESDIMHSYIFACYDSLHSQGKEYIVDDLKDVLRERGLLD